MFKKKKELCQSFNEKSIISLLKKEETQELGTNRNTLRPALTPDAADKSHKNQKTVKSSHVDLSWMKGDQHCEPSAESRPPSLRSQLLPKGFVQTGKRGKLIAQEQLLRKRSSHFMHTWKILFTICIKNAVQPFETETFQWTKKRHFKQRRNAETCTDHVTRWSSMSVSAEAHRTTCTCWTLSACRSIAGLLLSSSVESLLMRPSSCQKQRLFFNSNKKSNQIKSSLSSTCS